MTRNNGIIHNHFMLYHQQRFMKTLMLKWATPETRDDDSISIFQLRQAKLKHYICVSSLVPFLRSIK